MIRDKGVLVKRRRFLIKNNTRLLSGRHLASKPEPYMGTIAIFFIEEQAKPQGLAQK